MELELLPHQRQALDVIRKKPRKIIAMEQGCGKTAIGVHACEKLPGVKRALVIAPSKLVSVWAREYKKWFPEAQVLTYSGEIGDYNKVIVSMDTIFRKDHLVKFKKIPWDIVVIDEAHRLNSEKSQRSRQLLPFCARILRVLLLTGTPQTNQPSDLFNLLFLVDPREFSNRRKFTEKYCDGHYNAFNRWEERGAKNLEELHEVLSRYMIRALKADVCAHLPAFTEETVEMHDIETDDDELTAAKQEYYRLAKVYREKPSHSALLQLQMQTGVWWRATGLAKARNFTRWFKPRFEASDPGDKFLIWCEHVKVANLLHETITRDLGVDCLLVHGENSKPETRSALFDNLSSLEHPLRIGIINYRCGQEGLTIVPGPNRVITVEFPFSIATKTQAMARTHRIGTTRQLLYTYLKLPGSYDELIIKKLNSKEEIFDSVINGKEKVGKGTKRSRAAPLETEREGKTCKVAT